MTAKPYAEIRSALVEGFRDNPEKSPELKAATERWIGVIDHIAKEGEDADSERAFREAHTLFRIAAGDQPAHRNLSPVELAQQFRLGQYRTPQ